MISTVLKSKKPFLGPFCLISVLLSGSAQALTVESVGTGWLKTVGGAAIATPSFPGSDNYTFISVPAVSAAAPGLADQLIAPDNVLSVQLFSPDPSISVGVVSRFNGVAGFSNFGASGGLAPAQAGLYFEMWPQSDMFRIRGELRQSNDGLSSTIGTLGADFVQKVGQFTISAGPHLSLQGHSGAEGAIAPSYIAAADNTRSFGAAGIVRFATSGSWTTSVYANYDRIMSGQSGDGTARAGMFSDQVTIGASFNMTFPATK